MAGDRRQNTGHLNGVHPKLDLFNFDAPEHQTSRYILTSPRSLKACGRLGIKPVELLPKTLEEFATSSSGLGLQQGTLMAVYQEYERQRRAKLEAARKERERVISEQFSSTHKIGSPPPSCPTQVWSEGTEKRKGDQMRPFKNPSLQHQKRRSDVYKPVAQLPEKDQRLISAMVQHWSEEEQLAAAREEEAWQREVRQREEQREMQERQLRHQRELQHARKRFQKQLTQFQSMKQSLAAEEKAEKLAELQAKWERWECAASLQATFKAQMRAKKKSRESQRKEEQERRLRDLEEEEEIERGATEEYLQQLETRAHNNRQSISHRGAMKRQMRQEMEKDRYERKKAEVEAQNKEDHERLRTSLEGRHALARDRYLTQQSQRKAKIRQSAEARNCRSFQRSLAAERIGEELEDWRRTVDEYNKVCMTRAEETSQRLMSERSWRTHSRRAEREKGHSEKMKMVMEEEEERRQQTAMEVRLKKEKSEEILKERENAVRKARETALESAKVRGHIKEYYMRNSFDRMAQEAKLYASLERPPRPSVKNTSKVIIG